MIVDAYSVVFRGLGPLGLLLQARRAEKTGQLVVFGFARTSASAIAERGGPIAPGDVLVAVNDVELRGLDIETQISILSTAEALFDEDVTLHFYRALVDESPNPAALRAVAAAAARPTLTAPISTPAPTIHSATPAPVPAQSSQTTLQPAVPPQLPAAAHDVGTSVGIGKPVRVPSAKKAKDSDQSAAGAGVKKKVVKKRRGGRQNATTSVQTTWSDPAAQDCMRVLISAILQYTALQKTSLSNLVSSHYSNLSNWLKGSLNLQPTSRMIALMYRWIFNKAHIPNSMRNQCNPSTSMLGASSSGTGAGSGSASGVGDATSTSCGVHAGVYAAARVTPVIPLPNDYRMTGQAILAHGLPADHPAWTWIEGGRPIMEELWAFHDKQLAIEAAESGLLLPAPGAAASAAGAAGDEDDEDAGEEEQEDEESTPAPTSPAASPTAPATTSSAVVPSSAAAPAVAPGSFPSRIVEIVTIAAPPAVPSSEPPPPPLPPSAPPAAAAVPSSVTAIIQAPTAQSQPAPQPQRVMQTSSAHPAHLHPYKYALPAPGYCTSVSSAKVHVWLGLWEAVRWVVAVSVSLECVRCYECGFLSAVEFLSSCLVLHGSQQR